jgi:hypothetical protein
MNDLSTNQKDKNCLHKETRVMGAEMKCYLCEIEDEILSVKIHWRSLFYWNTRMSAGLISCLRSDCFTWLNSSACYANPCCAKSVSAKQLSLIVPVHIATAMSTVTSYSTRFAPNLQSSHSFLMSVFSKFVFSCKRFVSSERDRMCFVMSEFAAMIDWMRVHSIYRPFESAWVFTDNESLELPLARIAGVRPQDHLNLRS